MKHFISFLLFCNFLIAQESLRELYDADDYITKGIELFDAGEYEKSIAFYDKIPASDIDYGRAQYQKCMALRVSKKYDELEKLYQSLEQQKITSSFPMIYVEKAIFYSDQNKLEESLKVFEEAEKIIPNNTLLLYNKAYLYVKREERQKAVEYLKRSITNDPNHGTSLYLFGLLCIEDGHVASGAMSLMSYLANFPNGRFSRECVIKLNTKLSEFYKPTSLVISESGDQFSQLDIILKNNLSLQPKFKLKAGIDDKFTRQIQAILEYAKSHKIEGGFAENTFIPWMKVVVDKNYIEGYSYYALISFEQELGNNLLKHKKSIINFSDQFIKNDFWYSYASRIHPFFKSKEPIVVFYDNGRPSLMGKFKDEKREGNWFLVDENYQIISELYFEKNELQGEQKYYFSNSTQQKETTIYQKGSKEGRSIDYYKNGLIKNEENYTNDKLNGKLTNYYSVGGKFCDLEYVDGEYNGMQTCYYSDGTKRHEISYLNGELHGVSNYYFTDGTLSKSINYSKGKLDGAWKEYFENGTLKLETYYKNDEPINQTKEYFANQTVYRTKDFAADLSAVEKIYYPNGQLENIYQYNAKGQLEKSEHFDVNGNKYLEEIYKNDELKKLVQYGRNKKPVEININKPYVLYDFEGNKTVEGGNVNSKKNNRWKYYRKNGTVSLERDFVNGSNTGINTRYSINQKVYSQEPVENGNLHGNYQNFHLNGKPQQSIYYQEGNLNGPLTNFYANGNKHIESYYVNNEKEFFEHTYWMKGNRKETVEFLGAEVIKSTVYNELGEPINEFDFTNKTGTFSYNKWSENHQMELKNGKYNGKYTIKDNEQILILNALYVNGVLHGKYELFHPNGMPKIQSTFQNGLLQGERKSYDFAGKLRLIENYINGIENGKIERYYNTGKLMYSYENKNNSKFGEQVFYNMQGNEVASIVYEADNIIGYKILENDKLGEMKTVSGNMEIVSKYNNGVIAFKVNINFGAFDKVLEINSANGNKNLIIGYMQDYFHGDRIEYHENGKVYKHERFDHNDFHGIQEYFDQNGLPTYSIEYENDEMNGWVKFYDKGKVVKSKRMASNECMETKK